MSKIQKLILTILLGRSDKNIDFTDLQKVLNHVGFLYRIKGSHHIYFKEGVEEIINIQPIGSSAKPYQVKQVRELLIKYKLIEL